MVKEKNSDVNKFVYPATVIIDSLDPSEVKANEDNEKVVKGSAKSEEVGFE